MMSRAMAAAMELSSVKSTRCPLKSLCLSTSYSLVGSLSSSDVSRPFITCTRRLLNSGLAMKASTPTERASCSTAVQS